MGYWEERQAKTQARLTAKNIRETERQLKRYYKRSMEKIIGQFESTYNKVLLSIEDGKAPTPADLYKLDTYWKLQGQLRDELMKLGDKQAKLFSQQFMNEWQNIYDAIAIKDDLFFGEISRETAEQMINQIWCADGKNWSSRIWKNTDLLQQELNDNLIDCVLTGKKTTELKNILQERFNVSYNRADSIVRTEMAHIQTQAAKQRYEDSGIREVEVWADEDERRCDVCGKLHEKRFPIGAQMPIPAHPRCRCCIVPVVEDTEQKYEQILIEEKITPSEKQKSEPQKEQQNKDLTLQENDDNIKIPKDMLKQNDTELRKGIEKHKVQIQEHIEKIAHPERVYKDWNETPTHIQEGRINHWKKEIRNFEKLIKAAEKLLRQRGK